MQRDQVFELAWILPSVSIPVGMLVALVVSAYGMGMHVPTHVGTLDPKLAAQTAPFDNPGVRQISADRYEVVMLSQIWFFRPNEVRVPVGSEVTFITTSADVMHGLKIQGTNVNFMVLPGQISRATARFKEAGEFLLVCHEYCGVGHQTMSGKVIVSPP
ncbi:MAG: cytochrome c oxidase subunit II [Chloroflexota bacterium]